jgi:hypothetical protein
MPRTLRRTSSSSTSKAWRRARIQPPRRHARGSGGVPNRRPVLLAATASSARWRRCRGGVGGGGGRAREALIDEAYRTQITLGTIGPPDDYGEAFARGLAERLHTGGQPKDQCLGYAPFITLGCLLPGFGEDHDAGAGDHVIKVPPSSVPPSPPQLATATPTGRDSSTPTGRSSRVPRVRPAQVVN